MSAERQGMLRLYLDAGEDTEGRRAFALVVTDASGNEVLSAREPMAAKDEEEALYVAFFSMLEEALVLKGRGLQVFLGQPFAILDLDFDPARHADKRRVASYCERIRELVGAFEGVSSTLLSSSEPNPASGLLGPAGG